MYHDTATLDTIANAVQFLLLAGLATPFLVLGTVALIKILVAWWKI